MRTVRVGLVAMPASDGRKSINLLAFEGDLLYCFYMRSVQTRVFLFLIAVAALQAAYYAPLMPERMASHFDGAGHANGWSTPRTFFGLSAGMLVLFTVVFRVLPMQIHRFPDELINLPNKGYWLEPRRREATFQRINDGLLFLGNITFAFLLAVFQLVFQANLREDRRMDAGMMWALLAVLLATSLVWSIRFVRGFRVPSTKDRQG